MKARVWRHPAGAGAERPWWWQVDLPWDAPDELRGFGRSVGSAPTWAAALQAALDALWVASLASHSPHPVAGAHGPIWRPWRRRRPPGPPRSCR